MPRPRKAAVENVNSENVSVEVSGDVQPRQRGRAVPDVVPDTQPIVIDLSKALFADLALMQRLHGRGEALGDVEFVDWCERVVVGGVSRLPYDRMGDVIAALRTAYWNKGDAAKN